MANESKNNYWLPTRPYSLIDAINRTALAQGSLAYASTFGDADYNGHYVTVEFNNYRQHWVARYTWAGIHWLARGSFRDCVLAAKREFDRGALGATVLVAGVPEEETEWLAGLGFVPHNEEIAEAHYRSFADARYQEINHARYLERSLGAPAIGLLANSKTVEEYRAKLDAFFAERTTRLRAAR
jgi:hypothetical protein